MAAVARTVGTSGVQWVVGCSGLLVYGGPYGWPATAATPPPGRFVRVFQGAGDCAVAGRCTSMGPWNAAAAFRLPVLWVDPNIGTVRAATTIRAAFRRGIRDCDYNLRERGIRNISSRAVSRLRHFPTRFGCTLGYSSRRFTGFLGPVAITCAGYASVFFSRFFPFYR